MARGSCTFRQCDVVRLVKAATAAGLTVRGVRVDKSGVIEVVTGDSPEQDSSPLDQWMAKHACAAKGH
jgi:hypothetical protein